VLFWGDFMKILYKGFYFFIAITVVLAVYDYSKNNTVNWLTNLGSSFVFVFFYMLFVWFFNSFKQKTHREITKKASGVDIQKLFL